MSDQDFEEHPSINDDEERVRINRTLRAADVLAEAAKAVNESLGELRWDPTEIDFAEDHCQEVDKLADALAAYEKARGLKSNG